MNVGKPKPLALNLRKFYSNSGQKAEIEVEGMWKASSSTSVILIHGFNVDRHAAKEGYDSLLKTLKKAGAPDHFVKDVIPFYWPGNKRWSFLTGTDYFLEVSNAIKAAKKLSDFLEKCIVNHPRSQFIFVAHSLGSRLILEALINLISTQKIYQANIKKLCLMAAAVPLSHVEKPGSRLYEIRNSTIGISALHSREDSVLKKWFRTGQFFAFDGIGSKAIGLTGLPDKMWSDGSYALQIDHGDYWSEEMVAQFIVYKLAIPFKRIIAKNRLPENKMLKYINEVENKLGKPSLYG